MATRATGTPPKWAESFSLSIFQALNVLFPAPLPESGSSPSWSPTPLEFISHCPVNVDLKHFIPQTRLTLDKFIDLLVSSLQSHVFSTTQTIPFNLTSAQVTQSSRETLRELLLSYTVAHCSVVASASEQTTVTAGASSNSSSGVSFLSPPRPTTSPYSARAPTSQTGQQPRPRQPISVPFWHHPPSLPQSSRRPLRPRPRSQQVQRRDAKILTRLDLTLQPQSDCPPSTSLPAKVTIYPMEDPGADCLQRWMVASEFLLPASSTTLDASTTTSSKSHQTLTLIIVLVIVAVLACGAVSLVIWKWYGKENRSLQRKEGEQVKA